MGCLEKKRDIHSFLRIGNFDILMLHEKKMKEFRIESKDGEMVTGEFLVCLQKCIFRWKLRWHVILLEK